MNSRRASLALAVLFIATTAAWGQQAGIQYVYDAGRLVAIVDQQGNVTTLRYDAVGNVVAIGRVDASTIQQPVAITLVSPNRGRVGTQVSIFGKGFSATASENTVLFNSTTAPVAEAAPNRLLTVVPAGATTGLITLSTPLGNATSPSAFTVGGAIAVTPASVALFATAVRQFQATEGGVATADVTWAVNGITGGDPAIGTITTGGLYSAPATVSAIATTMTVTATHRDDRQASGSAAVTILSRGLLVGAVSVSVGAAAPGSVVTRNVGSWVGVGVAEADRRFVAAASTAAIRAPAIASVSPAAAAVGTTGLAITVTGSGFSGATALSFDLAGTADSNISVSDLQVNVDGTEATATISIASGAAAGGRVVRIITPAAASTAAGAGGNVFTVQ